MSGFRYAARIPRALLVLAALLATALVATAPAPALAAPAYAVTGEQVPEAHGDTEAAAPRPANRRRATGKRPAPKHVHPLPPRTPPARRNARPQRRQHPWPSSTALLRTVVLRC